VTLGWLRQRTPTQLTVSGILLLALASLLPDFRDSILPSHDARQSHSALHVLATGLRTEGEIPQWMPYGRYGNSSFLLLMNATPVQYGVALAGMLLPSIGTMTLLKVLVLLEFLLFLAGSLRLSLLLFRGLAPVAVVNIGAALSFSWLASFDANLHTFYLLPFILDSLIRFTRDGRVARLLLAALFCVVSAVGNVPYYPPMAALLLTIFCVVFAWTRSDRLPPLRFSAADLPLAIFILALAAAHAGGYKANLGGQRFYTEGRDPDTGRAYLHYFLEYNGVTTIPNLAKVFVTGAHTHGDLTFYIGLAPLFLALLGLTRCRRPEFFAVAAMAGFLILFSFGGIVARASYHFPGMAYYRHIGLIFGQAKYLILLLAGFGLEAVLQGTRPTARTTPAKRFAVAAAALLAVAELGWSLIRVEHPWNFLLLPVGLDLGFRDYVPALVRAAVYGTAFAFAARTARRTPGHKTRLWTGALLAAFLLDLGSFKVIQIVNWPPATPEQVALAREVSVTRPLPYRPLRVSSEEEEDRSPAFQFAAEKGVNACVYAHVYSLVGVDPRIPTFRVDSLTAGLDALFKARNVTFRQFPKDRDLPLNDRWLVDALGARRPKLRILDGSQIDYTPQSDAAAALRALPPESERTVLEAPPEGGAASTSGTASVTSFGYNHVSIDAAVDGKAPAWLYYADAEHPGWTARVDGTPTAISRANLAFKAVPLSPGRHRIELRYWNGWGSLCLYVLCAGSILFLAGLGVLMGLEIKAGQTAPGP